MNEIQSVRLDKWLWAARFYKTRTLAKAMIDGGKVHYNGNRVKPNKIVQIGAMIQLQQGADKKEVEVLALSEKRQSAPIAQKLYQETAQSQEARESQALARKMGALAMPNPERRPTKKERRELLQFKQQNLINKEKQ